METAYSYQRQPHSTNILFNLKCNTTPRHDKSPRITYKPISNGCTSLLYCISYTGRLFLLNSQYWLPYRQFSMLRQRSSIIANVFLLIQPLRAAYALTHNALAARTTSSENPAYTLSLHRTIASLSCTLLKNCRHQVRRVSCPRTAQAHFSQPPHVKDRIRLVFICPLASTAFEGHLSCIAASVLFP